MTALRAAIDAALAAKGQPAPSAPSDPVTRAQMRRVIEGIGEAIVKGLGLHDAALKALRERAAAAEAAVAALSARCNALEAGRAADVRAAQAQAAEDLHIASSITAVHGRTP